MDQLHLPVEKMPGSIWDTWIWTPIHIFDPLGQSLVLIVYLHVATLGYTLVIVLGLDTLLGGGGEIPIFVNSIGEVQDFNILVDDIFREVIFSHHRYAGYVRGGFQKGFHWNLWEHQHYHPLRWVTFPNSSIKPSQRVSVTLCTPETSPHTTEQTCKPLLMEIMIPYPGNYCTCGSVSSSTPSTTTMSLLSSSNTSPLRSPLGRGWVVWARRHCGDTNIRWLLSLNEKNMQS